MKQREGNWVSPGKSLRRHRGRALLTAATVGLVTVSASLVGIKAAGATAPTITSVVAGWTHTCVLTAAGGVKCWGLNDVGQLGDGTNVNRLTPVDVVGLSNGVTKIAAGGKRTCAIITGGTAKCWGGNSTGAIGDGTSGNGTASADRWTPTSVTGLDSAVTDITTGAFHSCAVVSLAGGVRCWGLNDLGQLGNGTNSNSSTPVAATIANAVSISAGGKQTCAVTTSNGAKCWGDNGFGQLGNGTGVASSTPIDVSGLTSGVSALAAGGRHTCALTSGSGVKCWGDNSLGQVGDGSGTNRLAPVDVTGLTSGVNSIGSGRWHSCAVTSGGAVKCWGSPQAFAGGGPGGGIGGGPTYLAPTAMPGLTKGVATLAGGEGHTCAVMTTPGRVECFGINSSGELGNGTTTDSVTPVLVRFPGLVLAAADFDGVGHSEVSVFRPSSGAWFVQGGAITGWGAQGDIPVPGDFDGDGKADVAVFRPANGVWYIHPSGGGADVGTAWGAQGDIPVPGDYDGDGKADVAVFRPSNGVWYIHPSGGGADIATAWGATGDIPVPADYVGDGHLHIAVFRPSNGVWYVQGGANTGWGAQGDIPVPGDFDGDGKADVAVFRPSTGVWYIHSTGGGGDIATAWGASGDIPIASDYDGDGKVDIGVFRQGVWYVQKSTGGQLSTGFGTSGDIPAPAQPGVIRQFFP